MSSPEYRTTPQSPSGREPPGQSAAAVEAARLSAQSAAAVQAARLSAQSVPGTHCQRIQRNPERSQHVRTTAGWEASRSLRPQNASLSTAQN